MNNGIKCSAGIFHSAGGNRTHKGFQTPLEIRFVVLPANEISLWFLVCPVLKYLDAK